VWKFVFSQRASTSRPPTAVDSFATNWTSTEFQRFVDQLGNLVDEVIPPDFSDFTQERAEQVWNWVVELEIGVWPDAGEEKTMVRV